MRGGSTGPLLFWAISTECNIGAYYLCLKGMVTNEGI